jgi:TonB dependent receptor
MLTASNSDVHAIPLIAGDGPDEMLILIDGFPILFPFRFLGILSMFNPLTIDRINLFDAGYSVQEGGHASSAIDVHSNTGSSQHPDIRTDFNLLSSSAAVHIPLSDTVHAAADIAVRTSNSDAVAAAAGADRDRLKSIIPAMEDMQFKITEIPSARAFFLQEGLLSKEHGNLDNQDKTFEYDWQKEFAGAAFFHSSGAFSGEHRISLAHDVISLSSVVPVEYLGSRLFDIGCRFTDVHWKSALTYSASPALSITAGCDADYKSSDVNFNTFSSWLNSKSPVRSDFADAAGFAESTWAIAENISLEAGLRISWFGFVRQAGIEPRGVLTVQMDRQSVLKISAGKYIQEPSDFQILYGFLDFISIPDQPPRMILMSDKKNDLEPETHLLLSVSASTIVVENSVLNISFQAGGYLKKTESLIMPARYPDMFTPLDSLSFEPLQSFEAEKSGIGISSIIGILPENIRFSASLFSHRSKILDTRTGEEYSDAADLPFAGKFLLQYEPQGWDVTMLYQYFSGMPTTEEYFLRTTNLFGSVVYVPLWKTVNSSHLPDYRRLDLSVTKEWNGDRWTFALSLNIFNVFGTKNVSYYSCAFSEQSENYTQKTPVYNTLPFLPNLGIQYTYRW